MTTPSEEGARELARVLDHAFQEWQWTASRNDQTFGEFAAPFLASRVSTPPSEDWEYGTTHVDTERPASIYPTLADAERGQEFYSQIIAKRQPRADGSLWPESRIMRRTKAVPAGRWEPVPAVPVLPTEPEEKR